MDKMYTIAVGNPFDGVTLYGMFEDPGSANEVAEREFPNDEWWIAPINNI